MPDDERSAGRPIAVLEIDGIDDEPRCPVRRNKGGQTDRRPVATQEVVMQDERQAPKGDNGQHGERAVGPHQLAVKGAQLREVLPPTKPDWNLEAGTEQNEVADAGEPECEAEECSHL